MSSIVSRAALLASLAWPSCAPAQQTPAQQASVQQAPADPAGDIVVIASRTNMLGKAATASEGSITGEEVALRPVYRAGQLFESIPGLVVTIHSGEGKANQYLIRGFNLDHGTDFANFVDDMPVNRPTNTHGQGYSDVGFLIPQLVSGIDYTKGPYHAAVGDFGSVASSHARLADDLPAQATATVSTDGYQDLFAGGTLRLGAGRRLLGAIDVSHYDGPWHPGENFRKVNAALRFSQGTAADGASLTGLLYQSAGRLITDQPLRAVRSGLIDRFGTLDPSDGSRSLRYSLSAHLAKPVGPGQLVVGLYAIRGTMTLWNDFTHYLDDPVNGDQEAQDERRTTLGGIGTYTRRTAFGRVESETVLGFQARYDTNFIDRRHTLNRRTVLATCSLEQEDGPALPYAAVNGYCNADRVHLLDLAPYAQELLRWTPWLRTVLGAREEFYRAHDVSDVTGTRGRGHQWLFQPKGSLILGPWAKTELYASAGRGFHSDDVRGVFGTVPEEGSPLAAGPTPLLARTTGYEVGLRTDIVPRLSLQVAAFRQDFRSELAYNADSGQDEAGASSRRKGLEISGQYHPVRWLELNVDLSFAKPRYRARDLAAFDLAGPYIADAPSFIYSAGVLVDDLGPWSGGLQWRRLGRHHLEDGEAEPTDDGYSEFNLDIGYRLDRRWQVRVSVFNIFDTRDDAFAFYYTSRLPGEPAGGVDDIQTHPLEPRSARFSLTRSF